jgi:hypothetical protein
MGRRTEGCTEMERSRWKGDREKAGGRKGRERGGGKKLRGTGEDEPPRYKEYAAFKKGRENWEGRGKGRGKAKEANCMRTISSFLFYYLFIYPYLSSFFQSPQI